MLAFVDSAAAPGDTLPVVEGVHTIGALPVIKRFVEQLRLTSIVNELLPLAPQAPYQRGDVLAALVMNKLTAPTPLYKLEEWARRDGVEPLLGVPPDALTDDRVARLLDEVAENVEELKARVCLSAIEHFGLDVGRFHWDLTSVTFEGDYDAQHPLWPLITYGYHQGNNPKRKQVRVANLVVGDGAVGGLLHKTYDGNHGDINTITDYVGLFCEIRDRFGQKPLLVGDSKLLGNEKRIELEEAGLWWLSPEQHSEELERIYAELPEDGWERVQYVSRRQKDKPPERQTLYKCQETEWHRVGRVPAETRRGAPGRPRKWAEKTYKFRRVHVFSSEEQEACRISRRDECKRVERQLEEQQQKFRSRFWKKKGRSDAEKAVERIIASRTAGKLYRWALKAAPEGGWLIEYQLDVQLVEAAQRFDGYYTLSTNIPVDVAAQSAVFADWKQQTECERRFSDWKGPLKVRPLFLKHTKRIVGLVAVLSIALLIFCLVERRVRQELREQDESMTGLLPVKRPVRATGRNVLQTLSSLTLVRIQHGGLTHWQIPPPDAVQQRLLQLLGVDLRLLVQALTGRSRSTSGGRDNG